MRSVVRYITSVIVCVCMVIGGLAFSIADNNCTAQNITVPQKYASITIRCNNSENRPLVVIVEDIHTNYSAQKNLSYILLYLMKEYHINLVGVEGASGLIDPSAISRFPDVSVKQIVADYFLKKGRIDGSEYLSIIKNNGIDSPLFRLYGIEDWRLYNMNLNSFLCTIPQQDYFTDFIADVDKATAKLKPHIYPPQMLQFDAMVDSFYHNDQSVLEYCKRLLSYAESYLIDTDQYTDINGLVALNALELSIDFNKANRELSIAIDNLSVMLDDNEAQQLKHNECLFKTKHLSTPDYITYLSRLFKSYHVSIENLAQLNKFIHYSALFTRINKEEVIRQADELTQRIYNELINTEAQHTLYNITRYIVLLGKLYRLQMSPEYVVQYKALHSTFSLNYIQQFITQKAREYHESIVCNFDSNRIKENMLNLEEFYKIAQVREMKMATNMLSLMDEHNSRVSILITGGFHTDGIVDVLKKHGISCVVITPAMEADSAQIPYLSLLNDYRTPFEQLISVYTSTLKVSSWLAVEPLVAKDRRSIFIAKMKTLLTTTKLHNLYDEQLKKYSSGEDLIIVRNHLQDDLKKSINQIISQAQYNNLLRVEAVEITPRGILGELTLLSQDKTGSETVGIRLYDTKFGEPSPHIIADNLLEMVNLSNGITEEFINRHGYLNLKFREWSVQADILDALKAQAYTLPSLVSVLREENDDLSISTNDVLSYLITLDKVGIVRKQIEKDANKNVFYSLGNDESLMFYSYILSILRKQTRHIPDLNSLAVTAIRMDNLPPEITDKYPQLLSQSDTILIDPLINFDVLFQAVKLLFPLIQQKKGVSFSDIADNMPNGIELVNLTPTVNSEQIIYMLNTSDGGIGSVTFSSARTDKAFTRTFNLHPSLQFKSVEPYSIEVTDTKLWELVKLGDESAQTILLKKHEGLVRYVVKQYYALARHSPYHKGQMNRDDWLSIARVGLLVAIRTFDNSNGTSFSTYALVVMKNELRRHFALADWLTQHRRDQIRTLRYAEQALADKLGKRPSVGQLAVYMNTSEKKINQLYSFQKMNFVSMDAPATSLDGDKRSFVDTLYNKSDKSPEQIALNLQEWGIADEMMKFLSGDEQKVLYLRYFKELPIKEVGKRTGFSHQGARNIEIRALEKMKALMFLRRSIDMDSLQKLILTMVNDLSPREREVIKLSFGDSFDEQGVADRLNFPSIRHFRRFRNEVLSQLSLRVFNEIERRQSRIPIYEEKIDIRSFLSAFFKDRQQYIPLILEEMILRSSDVDMEIDDVKTIMADYRSFLTPMEQELVVLIHYEGLNSFETAQILNILQQDVKWRLDRIQDKLLNMIKLRVAISEKTLEHLADILLFSINNVLLRNRQILIQLFYDSASQSAIGEKYGLTHSGVGVIKRATLKYLQKFMLHQIITDPQLDYNQFKDILTSEDTREFEKFVRGLILNISRDKFSNDKIHHPSTLPEILNAMVIDRFPRTKINSDTLSTALADYAMFLNKRNRKILELRYKNGLSFSQIAEKMGMTKNTFSSTFYHRIVVPFRKFLAFYEALSPEQISYLRHLLAESVWEVEEDSIRSKYILIYYMYDNLDIDQISQIPNMHISTNARTAIFYKSFRSLKDRFIGKIHSPYLRSLFEDGGFMLNLKYFSRGLKYEIPRSHFLVPEYRPDNIPLTGNTQIQDIPEPIHYNRDFLLKIYGMIGLDRKPTDIVIAEIASVIDGLGAQQFNVLNLKYNEHLTRKQTAETLHTTLQNVDSVAKQALRKMRKLFAFYYSFTPEELSALRQKMAQSLEELMITTERKSILIYAFYDNLSNVQILKELGDDSVKELHQKSVDLKKLQKIFLPKLESDRIKNIFAGSRKNMELILYSLKAEIPRSRFGIPMSRLGMERLNKRVSNDHNQDIIPEKQIEPSSMITATVQDKPIDSFDNSEAIDQTSFAVYNTKTVNDLFRNIGNGNNEELKAYLHYFITNQGAILPNPLIIHHNRYFTKFRDSDLSGQEIIAQLNKIGQILKLTPFQQNMLWYVFEKTGYIYPKISDTDVIVLDFDTMGFTLLTSANIALEQQTLAQYLQQVVNQYKRTGRNVNFVFFSQKSNISQIEMLLGRKLFHILRSAGNNIYSRELLDKFASGNEDRQSQSFLIFLMSDYDLNRVNFKIFSSRDNIMDTAKELGMVLADRGSTVFNALRIFANLHPSNVPDLPIRESLSTLADIVRQGKHGYFSIAGKEFLLPNSTRKRGRITTRRLLDQAL